MTRQGARAIRIEDCRYRRLAAGPGGTASATCELLEGAVGGHGRAWCVVESEVCESCCRMSPPSARQPNPVVASLLYTRASRLAASLPQGAEAGRLSAVAAWARRPSGRRLQ